MSDAGELFSQFLLTRLDGLPPLFQRRLLVHFGAADRLLAASSADLAETGLKPHHVALITSKEFREKTQREWDAIQGLPVRILSLTGPDYPARLKEIPDPPLLLFVRGDSRILARERCLAVVGSRNMTDYGRKAIAALVPPLVDVGFSIVSGMALGVDAEAHTACLEAGGHTIAVQAQGVDKGYPRANQKLFERLVVQGCAVSEYAFPPAYMGPERFPQRNRILSGLCDGVLVIEAAAKSGSLVTAYFAVDQNRQVYAVPGDFDRPLSRGCHELIKRGAKPVVTAEEVLEDFGLLQVPSSAGPNEAHSKRGTNGELTVNGETALERHIHELCRQQSCSAEDLIEATSENPVAIAAAITKMELQGWLQEEAGRRYRSVS